MVIHIILINDDAKISEVHIMSFDDNEYPAGVSYEYPVMSTIL
jgi:hypothetical protein